MACTSCESVNAVDAEQISFNGKKYVQTFYDDFDGNDLNLSNWERCPEWQRQDLGGYWKNDCSYVKDGNLVIEARKEGDKLYSGAIRSAGKFTQGYGLYKIRFKAQNTSGCWSAFWLMNPNPFRIGAPATDGAEIDIFEIISNDVNFPKNKRKYLNSAIHWNGYKPGEHKSTSSMLPITEDFYDQWHEVTFEWTPEYYKAWLDDNPEPYWNTEGQAEKWGGICAKKNYVKITAEFGKWGGPLSEFKSPYYFYVDWVKVYKPE